MLISTPYKNGDVISIKLASGEELVGKLVEEKPETIKVDKPMTLIMSQQGIGLQQWLMTVDPSKSITIGTDKVIAVEKTVDQFAKAYTEQTSSIVTAPAGLAEAIKA
jgi:hypothetical protein